MTVYAWPSARGFVPRTMQWRVVDDLQRSNTSPLSGYTQTVSLPGARWGWDMDFPAQLTDEREALEAYLLRLSGREHRVQLWDLKRPRPRGTCNLAGVTMSASAAQFAVQLQLAGCGVGRTLLAGDWIGLVTGQVVRVVANATANGANVMTVEVRHMLRSAVPAGSAVTVDRPAALYTRTESGLAMPRQPGRAQPPVSVSFVETPA